jgi:hypothetical protein
VQIKWNSNSQLSPHLTWPACLPKALQTHTSSCVVYCTRPQHPPKHNQPPPTPPLYTSHSQLLHTHPSKRNPPPQMVKRLPRTPIHLAHLLKNRSRRSRHLRQTPAPSSQRTQYIIHSCISLSLRPHLPHQPIYVKRLAHHQMQTSKCPSIHMVRPQTRWCHISRPQWMDTRTNSSSWPLENNKSSPHLHPRASPSSCLSSPAPPISPCSLQ